MNIVKNLFSTRVLTAIVSAVSAIICAVLAGCRLTIGEMSMKDSAAEILSIYCNTNGVAK